MNEIIKRKKNKTSPDWAYKLLLFNFIFLYLRIQEIIPPIRLLKIAGIASLILCIWSYANMRKDVYEDKAVRYLFGFFIFCALSSFGAIHIKAFQTILLFIIGYAPLVIAGVLLIDTTKRYDQFILIWCLLHLGIALTVFYNGGVGPGNFVRDENDTSLALGMVLPVAFYYAQADHQRKLTKNIIVASAVIIALAIISTKSRGGFLGLVSVLGMLWLFSKKKFTILFSATIVLLLSSSIIYSMLPEGYVEDIMAGFNDPEDSTRVERFRSWEIAWLMALDNPIFGVSPGHFPWRAGEYQVYTSWWEEGAKSLSGRQVHSMYFEVLGDLGFAGAFLFFSMIFSGMARLYKISKALSPKSIKKITPEHKKIALLARALFVAMVCYLISGAFISVTYYPHVTVWTLLIALTFKEYNKLPLKNVRI